MLSDCTSIAAESPLTKVSVATRELSREVALNRVAFPSGRAAVWPAVSGRVVRVLVSRGDYVTENQPLLELDDVRARRFGVSNGILARRLWRATVSN